MAAFDYANPTPQLLVHKVSGPTSIWYQRLRKGTMRSALAAGHSLEPVCVHREIWDNWTTMHFLPSDSWGKETSPWQCLLGIANTIAAKFVGLLSSVLITSA